MKYYLFFLLALSGSYSAKAQDSTIALSRFEEFTSQPNKVLKTEVREAGNFGWNYLTLFKTTDLLSGASASALRVGNFSTGYLPPLVDPAAVYIDLPVLDTLIPVLDRFIKESDHPRPPAGFRLSFVTSGDVAFTGTYERTSGYWQFEVGKVYKHLRTWVPFTVKTYNKKRFTEFVALLKQVQAASW